MRLRGYVKYPGILLRSFENRKVAGYVYSTIAALIVIALFSKTIAIVAFTMFVIGDACSGIAGAVWGEKVNVRHLKLPIKPVPILLMMFLVSFISGYSVTLTPRLEQLPAFVIAVGALGATLADGVPWQIRGRMLDDNLTMLILIVIPHSSAVVSFIAKELWDYTLTLKSGTS
jgi:dolichol kinase